MLILLLKEAKKLIYQELVAIRIRMSKLKKFSSTQIIFSGLTQGNICMECTDPKGLFFFWNNIHIFLLTHTEQ